MKDNNVPPLPHIPHRRRFFPVVDAFQKEATTEAPSINVGNRQTTDPHRENSGLASIETVQVPQVKRPSPARRPAGAETRPVPVSRQAQPAQPAKSVRPASANGVWRPGTLGFDNPAQDGTGDGFKQVLTIPMLVLKDISNQQGQAAPAMQSEISGATGAAAMVGIGNVAGTVFRYGSNLMIQRGFGAGAYGLYSLCMSLVTLASSIFTLGLDNAMIRYISIYRSKKQSRSLIGLTIFCTSLVGVTGIIGALLLMFLA
ncbi:MAG TPA: oligosaccharide flippase family protein, partial [Ktedonobacteraceae bacterium]